MFGMPPPHLDFLGKLMNATPREIHVITFNGRNRWAKKLTRFGS